MEEPLGEAVGNALEVREAVETLRGGGPDDLWALTLELGSHLLTLSGLAPDADAARARLAELRDSGAGLAAFAELVRAQGGDPRVVDDPGLLPRAAVVRDVTSDADGDRWVAALDARGVGEAALDLGAGRRAKGDPVDPAVGIVLRARIGDRVAPGAPLAELHARSEAEWEAGAARLRALYRLSSDPVERPAPRYEVIG